MMFQKAISKRVASFNDQISEEKKYYVFLFYAGEEINPNGCNLDPPKNPIFFKGNLKYNLTIETIPNM
jgi:hypothetical protein